MSGTYPFANPSRPRQWGNWPSGAGPAMVYVDAKTGHAYLCPVLVRCPATVPVTEIECPWSWLAHKPQFPGLAWVAITTDKNGIPTAVEAASGTTLPTDTRHVPDRLNLDGTTTTGTGGLYHVLAAEFIGGPGNPVRQVLADHMTWTPPEPATLATMESFSILDTGGRTITLEIRQGRIASAAVTGP